MDTKTALPTSPRDKPRPNPVSTLADVLKNIMSEIAATPTMRAISRAQMLIELMAEMQSKAEPPLANQQGPGTPLRQAEVVQIQKLETRTAALKDRITALDSTIKSGLNVVYAIPSSSLLGHRHRTYLLLTGKSTALPASTTAPSPAGMSRFANSGTRETSASAGSPQLAIISRE